MKYLLSQVIQTLGPELSIKNAHQILNKKGHTRLLLEIVAGYNEKSERGILVLFEKYPCQYAIFTLQFST